MDLFPHDKVRRGIKTMFVTTQGEYALRCMTALATVGENKLLSLKKLAQIESLSKDYVGKLLNRLKKAGLVRPVYGSRGGYALARPAREITVRDVYLASEGDGFKIFCLEEDFKTDDCLHFSRCGLSQVWRRVGEAAYGVMNSVTLEMLAKRESCLRDKIGD